MGFNDEVQGSIRKNKRNANIKLVFDTSQSKKEIIIASDVSSYRIRACIMHKLEELD